MTVTLFTSREDAAQWQNPAASAVSGPERYGTVTIGGLTPATSYWFRFSDSEGRRDPYVIGGPAVTAPSANCSATAVVDNRWNGGFAATVTIRNTGTQPLDGWRASWRWAGDERIQALWNGVWESTGSDVAVRNASYNATVAPGGSTTFGMLVWGSGVPGNFTPTCGR
jgi:cellulase/cellobiase CelA1